MVEGILYVFVGTDVLDGPFFYKNKGAAVWLHLFVLFYIQSAEKTILGVLLHLLSFGSTDICLYGIL